MPAGSEVRVAGLAARCPRSECTGGRRGAPASRRSPRPRRRAPPETGCCARTQEGAFLGVSAPRTAPGKAPPWAHSSGGCPTLPPPPGRGLTLNPVLPKPSLACQGLDSDLEDSLQRLPERAGGSHRPSAPPTSQGCCEGRKRPALQEGGGAQKIVLKDKWGGSGLFWDSFSATWRPGCSTDAKSLSSKSGRWQDWGL